MAFKELTTPLDTDPMRRCRRVGAPGQGEEVVDEASSAGAAPSCYTESIVNLKGNTVDSETGSFDLTDCGLEYISCLRKSLVRVGLPHGDVASFKDATTENELTLISALSQQPVSIAIEADQFGIQLGAILRRVRGLRSLPVWLSYLGKNKFPFLEERHDNLAHRQPQWFQ